jgi:hypothetical protein
MIETNGAHRRIVAGAVAVVSLALCCAAWGQQAAVWTPTSSAPHGLMTSLEGENHDSFIKRAQRGDIDLVFFGTTETEMWGWPERGRGVWDKSFNPQRAANFGSQGTRPESLLWRLRRGELNGYQAKVVVLQVFGIGDEALPAD